MTHDEIIRILNEHLEGRQITLEHIDYDLTQIGLDSIRFIRVIVAFESVFNIEIPDEYLVLEKMNTINKIYTVITSL